MNAKRAKNTRKTAKGGNSRKSGQKSSGSAKKRQSNTETSRTSTSRVTTPEAPTKVHINATLKRLQSKEYQGNLLAKPLTVGRNANAWIRLMAKCGVSRTTLLNCVYISRSNYTKAVERPSWYLTLHDLFFFAGITGVSVGEQIELLYMGSEVGSNSKDPDRRPSMRSNSPDLSSLVSED